MKLAGNETAAAVLLTVSAFSLAFGHATYTGYSGAPMSRGACASSCHGLGTGTITVSGFPTEYVPGQSYVIWVKHDGGAPIVNFNCSIRDSVSGRTTGALTAGLNTEVYMGGAVETQGVHFLTTLQDSGSFTWQADPLGGGRVTLYLAGLQSDFVGPNTAISLAAFAPTGVNESSTAPRAPFLTLLNRVVGKYLLMSVRVSAESRPQLRILDGSGRRVASISVPGSAGTHAIIWEPVDDLGRRLAPGSYFAALRAGGFCQTRRFTVVH